MSRRKLAVKEPGMSWWAFWAILLVVLYLLLSVALAAATTGQCGSRPQHWAFMPPGWQCDIDRTQGYTT